MKEEEEEEEGGGGGGRGAPRRLFSGVELDWSPAANLDDADDVVAFSPSCFLIN